MKKQDAVMASTLKLKERAFFVLLLAFGIAIFYIPFVFSAPDGVSTITYISNSTKSLSGGSLVNSTFNSSVGPGGYIFTMNLDALQQNKHWKAYVGNVTGKLTLDDANSYTIFDWTLSAATISGEIYASRKTTAPNWANTNCTWTAAGNITTLNRTVENLENIALSHTSSDDNISATFTARNHSQLDIGGSIIPAHTCYAILTYVNDSSQSFATSSFFQEILLYDSATAGSGNIVYSTFIEQDKYGYNNNNAAQNRTYDFQLIVPEVGSSSWTGSTGYYFYVELT